MRYLSMLEEDTDRWNLDRIDGEGGRVRVCKKGDRSCGLDIDGHGTHCASTAGGKRSGVAKGATLHGVKILDDEGSAYNAQVIAGMDWVAQNGKKPAVMSMSL